MLETLEARAKDMGLSRELKEALRKLDEGSLDPVLLGRAAELLEVNGHVDTAAELFALAAAVYAQSGGPLKAVALLKRALALNPDLTGARQTLVQLYETLGLEPEASAERRRPMHRPARRLQ